MKICSVEGCNQKHKAYGFCNLHYVRFKKYGTTDVPVKLCSIEGCNGKHKGLGYCDLHYQKYKKYGDPLIVVHAPQGSGYVKNGYKCIQINGKQYTQHRLIVEDIIGRNLFSNETVHHRNGIRTLNSANINCIFENECKCAEYHNLEIWSTHQPQGQRVADKLQWAYEIIKMYEPYIKKNNSK